MLVSKQIGMEVLGYYLNSISKEIRFIFQKYFVGKMELTKNYIIGN